LIGQPVNRGAAGAGRVEMAALQGKRNFVII
jgi:hypothetical protein